jgi:hypothetical protein
MINKKAIKEVFNKNIVEENKNNCKEVDKNCTSELQSNLQVKTSDLQVLLETLSKQLEEKDKQIKNLHAELNLQNKHAKQQSDRLVGLIEQVNELQRNNQVLLAQKDIKNKEIEEQKENKGMFKWFFKKNNN